MSSDSSDPTLSYSLSYLLVGSTILLLARSFEVKTQSLHQETMSLVTSVRRYFFRVLSPY